MTSLFFPDIFQTNKDLHFLSLMAHHCGIWYLGTVILSCYLLSCYRSSNDNAINLKAMIKIHIQFYFTSTMAVALKFGIGVFHVADD